MRRDFIIDTLLLVHMKEITLFFVVGIITLLGGLYALTEGHMAPVPGLGMILGVAAILQWWVAIRLQIVWSGMAPAQRAANPVLNQIRWLFTFGAIFATLDLFPHVILVMAGFSESTVTLAHWVTHLFLFIYLIIGARMAVMFFNPKWKNYVTGFVVLVSLAALAVSTMRPDYLSNVPGSAYPFVSSDALYAMFNMISNVTSVGIFGLYLIFMGLFRRVDFTVRVRAILMGVGFQGLIALGFFIHYSHSQYTAIMIYISVIVWALLTGLSALYAARWRS